MGMSVYLLDDEVRTGAPMHLDMAVDSTNLSWTVLDELLKKRPEGKPAHPHTLQSGKLVPDSRPVIFEALNGSVIRSAALRTKDALGPLGMDAFSWRHLYISFQSASDDLCNGFALLAKHLCTSFIGISALVVGWLIALNKCPGLRPIGVGEVIRRIVSKAVLSVLKLDILEAAGSLQLCAGQDAGSEASVHAMQSIFFLILLPKPSYW